jgi:hypothetical protein
MQPLTQFELLFLINNIETIKLLTIALQFLVFLVVLSEKQS